MKAFGLLHALHFKAVKAAPPGLSPIYFKAFGYEDVSAVARSLISQHDHDALRWLDEWFQMAPEDPITGDWIEYFDLYFGIDVSPFTTIVSLVELTIVLSGSEPPSYSGCDIASQICQGLP